MIMLIIDLLLIMLMIDLLLIMLMIDHCSFCSHHDLEIKLTWLIDWKCMYFVESQSIFNQTICFIFFHLNMKKSSKYNLFVYIRNATHA